MNFISRESLFIDHNNNYINIQSGKYLLSRLSQVETKGLLYKQPEYIIGSTGGVILSNNYEFSFPTIGPHDTQPSRDVIINSIETY